MKKPISEVITIREFLKNEETKFVYAENGNRKEEFLKKNRQYIIPGYQRQISWNPNNIQILMRDILEKPKFLGIILLSTNDYMQFEIIDGQQRITCILMILECLKREIGDLEISTCEFWNETFPDYNKVLASEFRMSPEEREVIAESDYLGQFDTYKELWNCVSNFVKNLSLERQTYFEEQILDSCICVLISEVDINSNESYRLCVDYFIDINNKSEHLNCIEILKAYAFRENYKITTEKWKEIQINENNLKLKKIYYPKKDLFLHYFMCNVNLVTNYSVKGINDEFKLKKTIIIDGQEHLEGTDVELLVIGKKLFYKNMLNDIEEFQKFMLLIERDKMTPSADFVQYFVEGTDFDTIMDSFVIISGIIHNSDVIPKMLLMKYFLFVMRDKTKIDNREDILFDINVLATSFSASRTATKSSASFGTIVLKEKWDEIISKQARDKLDIFIEGIGFTKEMMQNKQVTSTSGEYMARRVLGVLYAYSRGELGWKFDQRKYGIIMNTAGTFNCEHFFFDENQTYSFNYKGKNITRQFPSELKNKYIAYIGNYLLINKDINSEMGNKIIKYKIAIIRKHIDNHENNIFLDEYSEKYFEIAEECFENSQCPTQTQIDSKASQEEACEFIQKYISEKYVDEVINFIEQLCKKMQIWHSLKRKINFYACLGSNATEQNCIIEFISSEGAGRVENYLKSWPLFCLEAITAQTWIDIIHKVNSKEKEEINFQNTALEILLEDRCRLAKNVNISEEKNNMLIELAKMDENVKKCIYCFWDIQDPASVPVFFTNKDRMVKNMQNLLRTYVVKWEDMELNVFKSWMKRNKTEFKSIYVQNLSSKDT